MIRQRRSNEIFDEWVESFDPKLLIFTVSPHVPQTCVDYIVYMIGRSLKPKLSFPK